VEPGGQSTGGPTPSLTDTPKLQSGPSPGLDADTALRLPRQGDAQRLAQAQ